MPILPREGLTLEALCAPFIRTTLQPILTAPLLYALLNHPDYIPASILSYTRIKPLVKILKVLVTLGILRTTNNVLSKQVMNNWTTTSWRQGEEIAVVTGGASGIGELVVQGLASRSKAVIILDVSVPKASLRTYQSIRHKSLLTIYSIQCLLLRS
jgi:all-trans-retinol dehydrogenase (NAD+)